MKMASKASEELGNLYKSWVAEMTKNPDMGLDEIRDLFSHWGDVTVDPIGVDYVEVDAGGVPAMWAIPKGCVRSEEHTSELQSLMRISYAVFCLNKNNNI